MISKKRFEDLKLEDPRDALEVYEFLSKMEDEKSENEEVNQVIKRAILSDDWEQFFESKEAADIWLAKHKRIRV